MRTLTRKSTLLASATVVVMGLGTMSNPAMAFDDVTWSWDKTVTENVLKDVNVLIDTSPSGMVELEKIQMQIGDVTASSTVSNITNNPPGDDANPAPAPGPSTITIDLAAHYDSNLANNPVTGMTLNGPAGYSAANAMGNNDENGEVLNLTFDLTDENPAPAPAPIAIGERLGIDLPQVASAATAVGNNQDLSSSVSMELHDSQFLFGGFAQGQEGAVDDIIANFPDSGNTHTDIAGALALAAASGLIEPATISADSTVTGILNATVDSSATAVGNNMSIDLAAFTPDDAMVIADVHQIAYADVMATSLVDDVTWEGYTDLGAAGLGPVPLDPDGVQIPAVNSVATAVGNNFSLKVSSPEL